MIGLVGFFDPRNSDPVTFLVIAIPALWFLLAQGAKRSHDLGNSGWYQLIPFYVLWLLFQDSTYGDNEYGKNLKDMGNFPAPGIPDDNVERINIKINDPGAQAEKISKLASADSSLGTDQEIVNKIIELAKYYAGGGKSAGNVKLVNEVREIGRALDKKGGISEMRRIFRMVPQIQGVRTVVMQWEGIGDWRG